MAAPGEDLDGPLGGVRVIEIASWMAAPSGAAVLADLGAEVIKVEPLGGDPMRRMNRQPKVADQPDRPLVDEAFVVDNRGKRSIAVDLVDPRGAEVVRRLVGDAHVLVTNLLPRRQARFGLDPDTLLAIRPGLVHATLTGYGTTGPDAWRPGYDVTAFFGRAGLSHSLIEADGPPPQPRPAQGDHTTGLALVAAVLAALRVAERTGEGQLVEVSLFATAAWTMATDLAPVLVDGRQPSARSRHQLISPLANRFPCGDGRWVVFNMPEPRWWPIFCAAVDRPDLATDERYATPKGRFDHMAELVDAVDEALSARSREEWAPTFDEHGLIWGPVQTLAELAADPQAAAAGLWDEIEHPEVGALPTVAVPMQIRGAEVGARGPAPAIGEHTRQVLTDAGLDDDVVASLLAEGVLGAG